MKRLTINNIEVIYDESQESQIKYIEKIIINNYSLFAMLFNQSMTLSLIPTDNEEAIYVSDFDAFFEKIVNDVYRHESNKQAFENPDILPGLYIEYLIRQHSSNQVSLVQSMYNIDDAMLYSMIAYKYYEINGSFNDFINYLKNREGTDKILEWLQDNNLFETYNYLLEITTNYLKTNDFEFLENISEIVNKMLMELYVNLMNQEKTKESEIPKLTLEELDCLFTEFLDTINAPEEWKRLYQELKETKRITFVEQNEELDNSVCYKDNDNILKILITTSGTIKCFISLVHEFCHYVSMQNDNKLPPFSVSEFPSIFFEQLAALFLKTKGYSDDIVNATIKERKQNNLNIYLELSPLFIDILRYIGKGPILKQDKINLYEEQLRIINETKQKMLELEINAGLTPSKELLEMPEINVEHAVEKECEELIASFIQNGLLVINGYQYLFSTFLSDKILNIYNEDSSIISKMIMIVNKLPNMNLQKILSIFNLESMFTQSDSPNPGTSRIKKH